MLYHQMLYEIRLFIQLQKDNDTAQAIRARVDAARSFNDIADIYHDVLEMGEKW